MPSDRPDDVEQHLDAIERHIHAARGDIDTTADVSVHDFRIPTGNELRALRKTCGLSVDEVATQIPYEATTVRNVESGTNAPGRALIQTLLRLYRMEWPRGETYE
ncbi:helix-turn-helix transcriptional regulator [Halobellus sp. H-GB7]|uniref:helix-turn-helix domain-containing protein n=1 Tax=Halobellus sp. H-GB7 TaxID=3069756 RepID=UPI0027B666E1|nr:helix-turn-helix transcriptional regulator [Halobellus sp. H-GB7]MDQ2053195.1 helix-turn-helix transcriptional regulator [Halobellus sp. H-GB7]